MTRRAVCLALPLSVPVAPQDATVDIGARLAGAASRLNQDVPRLTGCRGVRLCGDFPPQACIGQIAEVCLGHIHREPFGRRKREAFARARRVLHSRAPIAAGDARFAPDPAGPDVPEARYAAGRTWIDARAADCGPRRVLRAGMGQTWATAGTRSIAHDPFRARNLIARMAP